MKGLDISSYQGGINFDAIKSAGIEFLILRAGFTGWGTGVNYNKDKYFEEFYNKSKSHNIPVGAYWYSCANTKEKGIAEAKFMYDNCLKDKQFEYPIYIDVEDKHHQVGNKRGVTDAIIGFCEYLENLGYYVGIYASDISGFKDKMYINELDAYDKWVARYGNKPKYVTNYGMWQSSSTGRINGYSGNLDTNKSYKDYESIIKSVGLNGYNKENVSNPLDKYDDERKIKTKVDYYKKCLKDEISIVDALKSINVDSSFDYRKKIAKKNGFINYEGTAKQNELMLDILKDGKLKKV